MTTSSQVDSESGGRRMLTGLGQGFQAGESTNDNTMIELIPSPHDVEKAALVSLK